ncbi:anaphase-promoting complex subunit Hcn1 [Podochytrium sp. JEL0797]|nr:anaphase-promoting complex subunit Hcn1 [Podochytrium sp. JEL0797]
MPHRQKLLELRYDLIERIESLKSELLTKTEHLLTLVVHGIDSLVETIGEDSPGGRRGGGGGTAPDATSVYASAGSYLDLGVRFTANDYRAPISANKMKRASVFTERIQNRSNMGSRNELAVDDDFDWGPPQPLEPRTRSFSKPDSSKPWIGSLDNAEVFQPGGRLGQKPQFLTPDSAASSQNFSNFSIDLNSSGNYIGLGLMRRASNPKEFPVVGSNDSMDRSRSKSPPTNRKSSPLRSTAAKQGALKSPLKMSQNDEIQIQRDEDKVELAPAQSVRKTASSATSGKARWSAVKATVAMKAAVRNAKTQPKKSEMFRNASVDDPIALDTVTLQINAPSDEQIEIKIESSSTPQASKRPSLVLTEKRQSLGNSEGVQPPKRQSTIPFDLIFAHLGPATIFLQLLRLLRLPSYISRVTNCAYSKQIKSRLENTVGIGAAQIFPICAVIMYVIHWNACVMYLLGKWAGFVGWSKSWEAFGEADEWAFYCWTFYMTLGNMLPMSFMFHTVIEMIFGVCSMILGSIMFAILIGAISAATLSYDTSGRLYNQKMDELLDYMRFKNLNGDTQERLISYYETKYRGKYFEEDNLLSNMNESLRTEVSLHNTRKLIEQVPFLRRQENDGRDQLFFGRIAAALKACYFTPGDFITKQGDSGLDMFFILQGKVNVLVNDVKVVSLYDGSYVGEVALLTRSLRTASIQAALPSVLYRLTCEDFNKILADFVDMKIKVESLAKMKRS